ncbi:MAG TPA: TrkA C-terminal domain-containing protein [Selenomonadales bacterium]|nr:TrkA C-terminal domain-containing protein [Selenomonadales bacterium]
MKSSRCIHESIALDLAERIANGEFEAGKKISGRTLLASHYGVSAETIRKAMALLRTANVVAVSQGKEILILSEEQAAEFVKHQASMQSAYSLRQELEILLKKKKDINTRFDDIVYQITRYTDRLRNLQPFNPVEVTVKANSPAIGKTIRQLRFRQVTGTTLVAIRRGVEVIVSPDPETALRQGDRLVVVGQSDVLEKVDSFINK